MVKTTQRFARILDVDGEQVLVYATPEDNLVAIRTIFWIEEDVLATLEVIAELIPGATIETLLDTMKTENLPEMIAMVRARYVEEQKSASAAPRNAFGTGFDFTQES